MSRPNGDPIGEQSMYRYNSCTYSFRDMQSYALYNVLFMFQSLPTVQITASIFTPLSALNDEHVYRLPQSSAPRQVSYQGNTTGVSSFEPEPAY